MLAFYVAILLPLQTPSLETKVTYRTRGATVSQVLTEIGRKAGIALEAAPAPGREIVVVELKDAKLADFLPRLATVAAGEWKQSGAVYRLVRSDDFARKSQAAEIERGAVRFAKELEARKVALKPFDTAVSEQLATRVKTTLDNRKAANDSDYFRAMQGLDMESPTGRLATRALAALGPRALAEVRPMERRVYSTRPNRMQKALPFDLAPILKQYQEEQTIYAASLRKRLDDSKTQGWYSGSMQTVVPAAPAKVLLAVARPPYGTGVRLELLMVDRENRIAQQARVEIQAADAARLQPPAPPTGDDVSIEFAPTSRAFLSTAKRMMGGAEAAPPPDLLKELEQPEKFDPVSFVLPDGLHAVAEGRNVVAQLEDISMISAAMLPGEEGKVGRKAFRTWLGQGHDLAETDGWLVVTPRNPWDARETRIDRGHMGRFFRAARAAGGVDLDAAAEYALGCPRRYVESLSFVYAFLLQPQVNSAIEMDNIDFVRLYGALSVPQRKILREGTSVKAGNLPANAQAELANLAFRADAPLQYHSSGGVEPDPATRPLGHEPTEAMPNGLSPDAVLTARFTGEPAVIGRVEEGGTGAFAYRPMRPWDLAWNMAENEIGVNAKDRTRYSKFKVGMMGNLDMDVRFTEMLGVQKRLVQSDFPPSSPWIAYAQLPEAFRAQVEKHLPEARTQITEMRKREAGDRIPPR